MIRVTPPTRPSELRCRGVRTPQPVSGRVGDGARGRMLCANVSQWSFWLSAQSRYSLTTMKRVLLVIVLLCASAFPRTYSTHSSHRHYHRSREVTRQFQRSHPCPSTGKRSGRCPGYVKDHVRALCDGGSDSVGNIQWQTTAAAKAKDRTECKSGYSRRR